MRLYGPENGSEGQSNRTGRAGGERPLYGSANGLNGSLPALQLVALLAHS